MEDDFEKMKLACPICGTEQTKLFLQKDGFNLHRCLLCGHLFVYPLVYDALSLYATDYFNGAKKGSGYVNYDKDKEPMRHVFAEYLNIIEKFLPQKGTLLDIGAATGFFMKIANVCGWKTKGIEISAYASEIAKKSGLSVSCDTVENSNFSGQSFDAISMWDVLEHLPHPVNDIHICARILKPGGILAINTPDSGSLYAHVMGKQWHLLVPPEHINYFTKKSITLLLEESGFVIEKISKIGKSFTIEYIVHTIAAWKKSHSLQKIVEFLKRHPRIGNISIPINLHDNMFIIARLK